MEKENTNKVANNGSFLRYDLVQEVNGKRIVLKSSQGKKELEKKKDVICNHMACLASFGIDPEPLGFVSVEPIWMIDGKEQVYYL